MKAKNLMGMIAFASACVSLSAFASTTNGWFGVTVEDPDVSLSNISTNGVGNVKDGAINLAEIDRDSALVFTPDASFSETNRNDGIYVIGASVVLNPCYTNDFKDVDVSGAKAGVVAGIDDHDVTNYYGFAGNEWHQLTSATVVAPGDPTEFYIILNYRDTNTCFVIGDELFGPHPMTAGETSALANIKAWGTGSISSVTGAFEVAVAAYGGNKYGSIAEAVAEAKKDSKTATDVQAVDDTGAPRAADATASNGLNLVLCEAMGLPTDKTTDEATIKLEAASKSHAGNITLAWKKPEAAEDGVTIKFRVMNGDTTVVEACDWDDIQIPMESGTYTVVPSIQ